MTTAIAFFVKTPGVSPLKTRLAKAIGQDRANEFFLLSVKVIEEFALELKKKLDIEPYWAVAEETELDNPIWKNLKRIHVGGNNLGECQSNVYSSLLKNHGEVLLAGADSPQINVDIIQKALGILKSSEDFVFGPAEDGGYYLFGGKKDIPLSVWESVAYSKDNTRKELQKALEDISASQEVDELFDVDHYEDILKLENCMRPGNSIAKQNLKSCLESIKHIYT